jgi:hypothetical protein
MINGLNCQSSAKNNKGARTHTLVVTDTHFDTRWGGGGGVQGQVLYCGMSENSLLLSNYKSEIRYLCLSFAKKSFNLRDLRTELTPSKMHAAT